MLAEFTEATNRVIDHISSCLDLASQSGDKTLCNTLSTLKAELENFSFNVAVVGDIKRGKSTLINTLLGRTDDDLSPVGVTICTSAIVKYRNYKAGMEHEPHAMVYYENAPSIGQRVTYDDLRDLISQKSNPDNVKGVRVVEVYGDFPLLGKCCLVDTPGANATIERHGEMVSEFLPSADAIIMPVMAGLAMTDSEQEMLRQLSDNAKRRIFYVLTKVDRIAPEELQHVLGWCRTCIHEAGLPAPETIYQVACKKVFNALKAGESEERVQALRMEWGVERLERDLGNFMLLRSEDERILVDKCLHAMELMKRHLEAKKKFNESIISSPDVTAEEIDAESARVRAEFNAFQKDIQKSLDRFSSRWDKEVARAVKSLEDSVDELTEDIRDVVREGSFASLFSLNTTISKKIHPRVRVMAEKLNSKLTPLVETLNKELVESSSLYVQRTQTNSLDATLGALAGIGGAAASVMCVSVPAIGTIIHSAQALIFLQSPYVVACYAIAPHNYILATLVGASIAAIVPIVVALAVTGPAARWFVGTRVPSNVEKAMTQVRDNLTKQLANWKGEVVSQSERLLENQREEMEDKLETLRRQLLSLDPATREQAQLENKSIETLLAEEATIITTLTRLPRAQA